MTTRLLVAEIGATHLSFAANPMDGPVAATERIERMPRMVTPAWHTAGPPYAPQPPATGELLHVNTTIQQAGDTVARLVLVPADPADRSALASMGQTVGRMLNRMRSTPAHGWVTAAGLPEPTIVDRSVAAAHQAAASVADGHRVLVIDVGARAATLGLVGRIGERFEVLKPPIVVPAGGDRVDQHLASLAMRANVALNPLRAMYDPNALSQFFGSVRAAKHALSGDYPAAEKAPVQGTVNGTLVEVDVYRSWLERDMTPEVAAIAAAAQSMSSVAPHVVLLVGGAAHTPMVEKHLRDVLRREVVRVPDCDLAAGAYHYLRAAPPPPYTAFQAPIADQPPAPPRPAGWTLAIDFGTTYTVTVVVGPDGTRRVIDVEGNAAYKMPSSVVRTDDGTLAVGKTAVNQAAVHPAGFVATPKRLIGKDITLLGGEPVPIVDLVAAVLRRCAEEARRRQDGMGSPETVVLTHPATWVGHRLDVLRAAAAAAGLGEPRLIEEPVAAAQLLPESVRQAGKPIAVYDFGGGTFDAAVLRPTATGFEVAGPPGGCDRLGGEDIDDRIIDHLGSGPAGAQPEWEELMTSEEPRWKRDLADLRSRVREAKETLSRERTANIWIQGLKTDHLVTRAELQELIEDDVKTTVAELASTIAAAGMTPQDIGGIYLIGGSSQLSLVSEKITEHFGIEPTPVPADPKTVVAEGAAIAARPDDGVATHRRCRLGAAPSATPGIVFDVEHRLTVEGRDTVVRSVPNRWPSQMAYVVDQQQRAIAQGDHYEAADHGSALGADGAVVFPTTGSDGRGYWSSYQVVGGWAIHGRWPDSTRDIDTVRIIADPASGHGERPPLEFAADTVEPVETLTIHARVPRVPGQAVIHAYTQPVRPEETAKWLDLFLTLFIQTNAGIQLDLPERTTFKNGAPCTSAKYRHQGKRGRCWYGIVNERGVCITVETPFPLPTPLAVTLRDAVAVYP